MPFVTKDPSEVAAVTVEPVAPRNLADCRQGFGRSDRQWQRVTKQLPYYTVLYPIRPVVIARNDSLQATTAKDEALQPLRTGWKGMLGVTWQRCTLSGEQSRLQSHPS